MSRRRWRSSVLCRWAGTRVFSAWHLSIPCLRPAGISSTGLTPFLVPEVLLLLLLLMMMMLMVTVARLPLLLMLLTMVEQLLLMT